MDAIEYFKGMRKRLCEDHLKLLPKKSVGYQTTLREMSFYDAAIKALEQEPCNDTISRQEVIEILSNYGCTNKEGLLFKDIRELPSVKPQYTDDEIQKMQDLEQAEFEKAYELGKAEGQKGDDAISRQTALNAFGLSEKTRKYGGDHSGYNTMMMYEIQDVIEGLPSVSCLEKPNRCEDAISRSDAIRVASGYCHWTNIPDELAKLPSVNPIPCDDAISRQEALNAMNELPHEYRNKEQRARTGGIAACKMIVEELPSVSTEKTWRWKRRIVDSGYNADWSCSCCGYKVKTDFVNFNYCPNCGARMGVEE